MVLSWKASWDVVRDGTQDWVELIAVKILTVMAYKHTKDAQLHKSSKKFKLSNEIFFKFCKSLKGQQYPGPMRFWESGYDYAQSVI